MTKKILIIEDDINQLNFFKNFFSHRGFEVVSAASGIEAIQFLIRQDFDFIISDIMLGQMNSDKLFSIIRAKNPETQVILLSKEECYHEFISENCDFINKPLDYDKLLKRVS